MQRYFAALEYRANCYGKLSAAVTTEIEASTMRFTIQRAIALNAATVRAYSASGPAQGFKVLAGSVFVVEFGFGKHGNLLM
jgi:hypothetical protein